MTIMIMMSLSRLIVSQMKITAISLRVMFDYQLNLMDTLNKVLDDMLLKTTTLLEPAKQKLLKRKYVRPPLVADYLNSIVKLVVFLGKDIVSMKTQTQLQLEELIKTTRQMLIDCCNQKQPESIEEFQTQSAKNISDLENFKEQLKKQMSEVMTEKVTMFKGVTANHKTIANEVAQSLKKFADQVESNDVDKRTYTLQISLLIKEFKDSLSIHRDEIKASLLGPMGRVDTLVSEIQQINNNYKNVLTKLGELSPKLEDANNKMLSIVDSIGTNQTKTQTHVDKKFDSIVEYLQEQFDQVIKKADAVVLPNEHNIKIDKISTKVDAINVQKINDTIQKLNDVDIASVQNKVQSDTQAIVGESENQIKKHVTQEVTKVVDTVKPIVEGIETLVFNSNRPNDPDNPDTQMQYDNYTALVEDFKTHVTEMNNKFTELSQKIQESATQYNSQMQTDTDFSALLTQAQTSFSQELARILNKGLSPIITQLSEQDKLAYMQLQKANTLLEEQLQQRIAQKEALDKEIQNMQLQTIQFQTDHSNLRDQINASRQTIGNLQNTIRELKTNKRDVDNEQSMLVQKIRQEISQGQSQIVEQQQKIQELQSQETELNKKIATLSGQVSQSASQLGTDNVKIQGLNERIQVLTQDIEQKRKEQNRLVEYTSSLNGLSDELSAKIQDKEQRAKRLDQEIKYQLDKLDEAVSKLNSVKQQIQQQIVLNTRLEKEKQKHEEKIAKLAKDSLSQKLSFVVSDKRPSTAVEKPSQTTLSQQKLTSNPQQQVESPSSLIQKSSSQKQLKQNKQESTHQIDLGFDKQKSKPIIKRAWADIEPSSDYQKPFKASEEVKQEFEQKEQERIEERYQEEMTGQGSSDSDEQLVKGLEQINVDEESSDTLWLILAGVIGGVAVGGCVYKHWKDKKRQDDSN